MIEKWLWVRENTTCFERQSLMENEGCYHLVENGFIGMKKMVGTGPFIDNKLEKEPAKII